MEGTARIAISISRQRGCGGSYLGQRIAAALGITYLDRELVAEIAKKLEVPVEAVEVHDERIGPLWESIVESLSLANPWLYNPPPITTSGDQVRQLEMEAILKVADEQSVVVVGRGSSYVLRNHSRHASIFLHASKQYRIKRLQDVYHITPQEAIKTIDKTDKERAHLKKTLTGTDMADATQYHLTLDTGVIGLDNAGAVILQYVRSRFGDLT